MVMGYKPNPSGSNFKELKVTKQKYNFAYQNKVTSQIAMYM